MNDQPVLLSEPAATKLKEILSDGKHKGIRLSIKPTEDGAFAPSMFLVDQISDDEVVFDQKGIPLLMDQETAEVLEGAEIDVVKEGDDVHFVLSGGLRGGCGCGCGDEAEGSCGCGE